MKHDTIDAGSLVERDRSDKNQKHGFNAAELILHVARKTKRGAFAVGRDARRWKKGPAKIWLDEYVQYGLYDPARHSEDERANFISGRMHKEVVEECIDQSWFAVTEDKWLSHLLLSADGVPVPETLAVVDRSARRFAGALKITNVEDLKAYLADAPFPLFGKYNNGKWSMGAFAMVGADETSIHLRGGEAISYHAFFDKMVGEHTFLIQKFVENHPVLKAHTDTVATVRMVNMWTKEGLWSPYAILKLPSSKNQADNFWREGNLVCNLDPETGDILTIVGKKHPELVSHEVHPDTGAELIGTRLPHWDRLREVNAQVAALHQPIQYQSQDIAITEDGPVVIEINTGGAFELYQIASGKGFMQPKVRQFFRDCGSTKV